MNSEEVSGLIARAIVLDEKNKPFVKVQPPKVLQRRIDDGYAQLQEDENAIAHLAHPPFFDLGLWEELNNYLGIRPENIDPMPCNAYEFSTGIKINLNEGGGLRGALLGLFRKAWEHFGEESQHSAMIGYSTNRYVSRLLTDPSNGVFIIGDPDEFPYFSILAYFAPFSEGLGRRILYPTQDMAYSAEEANEQVLLPLNTAADFKMEKMVFMIRNRDSIEALDKLLSGTLKKITAEKIEELLAFLPELFDVDDYNMLKSWYNCDDQDLNGEFKEANRRKLALIVSLRLMSRDQGFSGSKADEITLVRSIEQQMSRGDAGS